MDEDEDSPQPMGASKTSCIDTHNLPTSSESVDAFVGRPVVVGATVLDVTIQVEADGFQMNGSIYPGHVCQSLGGVGRNLADCLSRLGAEPVFLSVVGCDSKSEKLFESSNYMDLSDVKRMPSGSTAIACVILDSSGHVLFGVCDMTINDTLGVKEVALFENKIRRAPIVVLDSNFPTQTISYIVNTCYEAGIPVWFEPTDSLIAAKVFDGDAWRKLSVMSPNFVELRVMWTTWRDRIRGSKPTSASDECDKVSQPPDSMGISDVITKSLMMCRDLVTWVPVIVLTLGCHGALLCHAYPGLLSDIGLRELTKRPKTSNFHASFFPAVGKHMDKPVISSTSGAGDCLSAAVIAGLLQGKSFDSSMKLGVLAANVSLQSKDAVPDTISPISVSQEVAEESGWVGGLEVTDGWKSVIEEHEHGL